MESKLEPRKKSANHNYKNYDNCLRCGRNITESEYYHNFMICNYCREKEYNAK